MNIRPLLIVLLFAPLANTWSRPALASGFTAVETIAGATPVTVVVGSKPRVYFRLVSGAPLKFSVEGPARVRVVSRAECRDQEIVTYRLVATEATRELDRLQTESSASSEVHYLHGPVSLGKSRRLGFSVPKGRHEVVLSVSGVAAVAVRIQTSRGRAPEHMVSLTPVQADHSVGVSEGEKLIPYYSVVSGSPVRLRVIGPTSLEISSRLDFDATMRGMQGYRLRVVEGNRTLREWDLKTTKALGATYANVRDRVPSKVSVSRLLIPSGSHDITVQLLGPPRATAQIHARIPEPSVGNEE